MEISFGPTGNWEDLFVVEIIETPETPEQTGFVIFQNGKKIVWNS